MTRRLCATATMAFLSPRRLTAVQLGATARPSSHQTPRDLLRSRPRRDRTIARELRRIWVDVTGGDTVRDGASTPAIYAMADQASASASFTPNFFTSFAKAATN